ncbi:MAG: aldehyde dehydrogenase family protein [Chloroflexi bacterium]|nr:MAG: aldehyde dehydrogenase family protein [Chloroflexota bacterium]TMG34314.1 MAG: aldehyde dehydrogenase family protein [Chloroflexota bacterium]
MSVAAKVDGRMFVNGERAWAGSGKTFEAIDPATGEAFATVASGSKADVDAAVISARHAYEAGWALIPPVRRVRVLNRLAVLMREHSRELAELESLDVGKPLKQAEDDVTAASGYFEYFAGVADKVFGSSIPLGGGFVDFTLREPIGVSAQIVPWNYPLRLSSRGIAPALACGNGVVAKPAAEAGLSVVRIAELAVEAGVPKGVFNVVTGVGAEAGSAIASHPGINHITFTGSVPTGIAIMKAAADNVVPVTLELGGKSPNIIFADADLEKVAASAASTLMQNSAQTCTAPTRLLVERSGHDRLVDLLAQRIRQIRLGRGLENPDMGPVVSERQMRRVLGYIETGSREGAKALTGGGRSQKPELARGFFIEPTLLDAVAPGTVVEQEEIFGPVLTATTFESVDEAIAIANGTAYGLVTGIWTADLNKALKVATGVKSGQIRINGYGVEGSIGLPFGGYKRSGFGREQGVEALLNYTVLKNVMINFS